MKCLKLLGLSYVSFLALFLGCSKDMAVQEKYLAQNHVMTLAPENTVASDALNTTGGEVQKSNSKESVDPPASLEYLKYGQQRFEIHCSPCHDRSASGNGIVVARGFAKPPPLYIEGVSVMKDQDLYGIISDGFGSMPAFRHIISDKDRLAIISYLRVLQLSHRVPAKFLEEEDRQALDTRGKK